MPITSAARIKHHAVSDSSDMAKTREPAAPDQSRIG
jgi:hypothetical protein